MSFPRMTFPVLSFAIVMALLVSLLPAATLAAGDGEKQLYMVSLDVTGSDRAIRPSTSDGRARIAARAERTKQVTERLQTEHGVKPRHRYRYAITGFSARMTPAEARALARDAKVASVWPARRVTFASQDVEDGVRRVKATYAGSGTDVDARVAVLDTGIGPSETDGNGLETGVPIAMTNQPPQGKPELNIAGGVNCYDDSGAGRWADTHGHGTHVAGVIGARDNSVGTVGVAPGVKLYSVRVFKGGFGTEANVVCGLDWVIARNSDANPNNDIDVVNMSLEMNRRDFREDCDAVVAQPGDYALHKAVCTAFGVGITMVAAAGNDSRDTNLVAPGGYEQVITVGAVTDTDGDGWGLGGNATCSGYTSQRDDDYATGYSNYGIDVDIVAPGTCVRSTWPTASGAAVATMTGTSMAAPHVTGAVARYLADDSGTTPSRMRRLVRASGRMDWDAKSDPEWDGTADDDPPNRVLDVSWLMGAHRIKTWVYHGSFKVGGTDDSRTTRVDVQRGGGYGDTVTLTKSGLPGGASASFDDNTLAGLGADVLGTNLDFDFELDGQQGHFDVTINSNGPGVSPYPRGLSLTVDRTGPAVADLGPKVRKVMLEKSGKMSVQLQWQASDVHSSVATAKLQRKIGSSSSWKNSSNGTLSSAIVSLKPAQDNRFRVKATDSLGNTKWSSSIGAKLGIRDSSAGGWQKPAAWTKKKVSNAYGGSILLAKGATPSLSTDFFGTAVGIAASVGPGRGSFKVRVDGGAWETVSLKTSSSKHRKVAWAKRLGKGAHTIDIKGVSGQSTIDALLFVR